MSQRLTSEFDKEKYNDAMAEVEWDHITEAQGDLLASFEEQFEKFGGLTEKQQEILENISFKSREWASFPK